MKKLTIFFLAVCLPVILFGKSRVNATDIMNDIENGKNIKYNDVEIVGELNFSFLSDYDEDKNWGNREVTFWHHVRVEIEFTDCIFRDGVIAYFNDEDEDIVHNAIFHKDVTFSNCQFKGLSEFKYVRFERMADFDQAQFDEEANFKYTKFEDEVSFNATRYEREANFKYSQFNTKISFANSEFGEEGNFKYTKFEDSVDFNNAIFTEEANFKYTKFPEGVNFSEATFRELANFKYTKFSDPTNFDNVKFQRNADFKHTTLNGRKFKKYHIDD